MIRIERLLYLSLFMTLALSGGLLGIAQGQPWLTVVAVGGSAAALLVTEYLKWFRIDQWLANLAAVIMTMYALFSFGNGDGVSQLMAVANLLVYLQIILLLQHKSPRLFWQVLVLSLLQVVVAAVFNLGLEGGLLFVAFTLCAGLTLMLLQIYQETWNVLRVNHAKRRWFPAGVTAPSAPRGSPRSPAAAHPAPQARPVGEPAPMALPIPVFDQTFGSRRLVTAMARHLGSLAILAIGFASVMFYFIPRDISSWVGPHEVNFRGTGETKQLTLDYSDQIILSDDSVMRVAFRNPHTNRNVELSSAPYMRGVALADLNLESGSTEWIVAQNRNYDSQFQTPKQLAMSRPYLIQQVTLEPTIDPLLYAAGPCYRLPSTSPEIEYYWPLFALTRQRGQERRAFAPFTYEVALVTTESGQSLDVLPHGDYAIERSAFTLESGGYYLWLTEMPPPRYPTLVQEAADVARQTSSGRRNHLTIARALEEYLRESGRFTYTLDYTALRRDRSLDPMEDFVRNHRSGHCEMFASALTLMLRSQGIPARLVVGYYGGEYNAIGQYYEFTQRHAHAWVEAYIRPQDCPQEWLDNRIASNRGAWVVLDPTPPSDNSGTTTGALGYARSLWRDYVWGLSAQDQFGALTSSSIGLTQLADLGWWYAKWQGLVDGILGTDSIVPIVGCVLVPLALLWALRIRRRRKRATPRGVPSRRRRLPGWMKNVVRQLTPGFLSSQPQATIAVPPSARFYRRMTRMLARHGLVRRPAQTQRALVVQARDHFREYASVSRIVDIISEVTEAFYGERFGTQRVTAAQQRHLEAAIGQLATTLSQPLPRPNPDSRA
jgi:transglutaminase-like putative cysteine protease